MHKRFVTVLVVLTSLLFITANYGEDISDLADANFTDFADVRTERTDNRSARGYWSMAWPSRQNEPVGRIGPSGPSTKVSTAVEPVRAIQTRNDYYDYHQAPAPVYHRPSFLNVDFSPLFVALIPIALFLGAASALALAVATTPNTAVATAQQQQQQQEANNNNANNANNNNMASLLAGLFASTFTQNNQFNNQQQFPFIFPINSTAYAIFSYANGFPSFFIINNGSFFVGRSSSSRRRFRWPVKLKFNKLDDS